MSAALLRSALRARVALLRQSETTVQAVRCMASGPRQSGSKSFGEGKKSRREDDGLYDPYKIYQGKHGKPGVRESNPEKLDDLDDFEWEEPEELMADKSWPQTSGTDMFADLINVSGEVPAPEKLELILKEFYRRVDHKSLDQIELPAMDVAFDEENPDKEALEIMQLSLMNNGRITMDDKNEIMASLVDELQHVRKDTTTLFKNLD